MYSEGLFEKFDDRACRIVGLLAVVGIFILVLDNTRSYIRLRHIPGPPAAALTNFVRRSWVNTGNAHEIHTNLHSKYGTVVRFGPNAVMVSQPDAIEKIYGFKRRFEKVRDPSIGTRRPVEFSDVYIVTTLTSIAVRVLRLDNAEDKGRQDSRCLRYSR